VIRVRFPTLPSSSLFESVEGTDDPSHGPIAMNVMPHTREADIRSVFQEFSRAKDGSSLSEGYSVTQLIYITRAPYNLTASVDIRCSIRNVLLAQTTAPVNAAPIELSSPLAEGT
jgi:hypothetical protein